MKTVTSGARNTPHGFGVKPSTTPWPFQWVGTRSGSRSYRNATAANESTTNPRPTSSARLIVIDGLPCSFQLEQIEQQRRHVLEHGGVQRVDDGLAAPFGAHEIRGLQDIEVVRERALRHVERLRELARRLRPAREELQHLSASRIGNCPENLLSFEHFDILMN